MLAQILQWVRIHEDVFDRNKLLRYDDEYPLDEPRQAAVFKAAPRKRFCKMFQFDFNFG